VVILLDSLTPPGTQRIIELRKMRSVESKGARELNRVTPSCPRNGPGSRRVCRNTWGMPQACQRRVQRRDDAAPVDGRILASKTAQVRI